MNWRPEYIILIILSTVIDYYAGLKIAIQNKQSRKKVYLYLSLISNLGFLFTFKYFNFFNHSLYELSQFFHFDYSISNLNVLLPVGISFYTFQTLSYTINVYRGIQKPEKHFGIFALYVSFFPQLVAGPIERSERLLPQFYENHKFQINRVISGLKIILWGFFLKLVVADRLAIYVNTVYNNPHQHSGFSFLIATIFFAFQIYGDFAGYSLIAIGSAKILGFDLMTNFRRPYFSKSISEFWKRWHISLSTWFRDYLYISLGGNRVTIPRWYLNLFLTFLISGLWHGANWTFVLWGALNGFYLIFSIVTTKIRNNIKKGIFIDKSKFLNNFILIIITFILTCFAWIFFRSNTLSEAFFIIHKILFDFGKLYVGSASQFTYSWMAILILIVYELKNEFFYDYKIYTIYIKPVAYSILLAVILLFGVFNGSQFIYFQF